ncbi:MAG: TetR family transcriptional regulator C-terminal domain-containing protein [Desulfobacterium sp.]|nr:TetR family transcriptional regulator C-terminal domain-containing protein [Desulfobacterium sp.]
MKSKTDKKNQMIDAGLEIMYRKGYNATGIQEIVDNAGVPKGSFYNYFKNKEQFAVEILDHYTGEMLARQEHVLSNADLAPLARIESLYKAFVDEYVREGAFCLGCFAANLSQEMGDTSDKIRRAAEASIARMTRPVEVCLMEAREKGDISIVYDASILAVYIQNSWLGALMRMKASKSELSLMIFLEVLGKVILK